MALGRCHRANDGLDPVDLTIIDVVGGRAHLLGHARHELHQPAHRAHLADLAELLQEVIEREGPVEHAPGRASHDLGIHRALGLLDERQHIAHPEDAIGHTVRVELLEILKLLARRSERNGTTHDALDAQRRTATRIAVELGQDDAVELEGCMEGRRGRDRVLSRHGIDDQEGVVRRDRGRYLGHLVHERGIDRQTTSSVHDEDVTPEAARLGQASGSHRDRIRGLREDRDTDLLSEDTQLLNRSGALKVSPHQQRLASLLLEPTGQLGRRGGLAGSLETSEQHHGGWSRGIGDREGLSAERSHQLLVDGLDDLLTRRERLGQLRTGQTLTHPVEECSHHTELDIGLEQRRPDLLERFSEVSL